MPELPEVETVRRGLEKVLLGQRFLGQASQPKVSGLRRFGKLLIIDFDNGKSMAIHLRMTGQLVYRDREGEAVAGGHPNKSFVEELPDKSTREIFEFEKGTLFFNDQRKFGFVEWVDTDKVEEMPFVAKLGKEPWIITLDELKKKLERRGRSKVKGVLLDQTVMAGLGNIYADETLYLAKVHPERLVGSLTDDEIGKLIEGAKSSMDAALDSGGSSLQNYLQVDGSYGDYLTLFAEAYGRKGEPCRRCETPIEKIKVAGRGTHFCPSCQILLPRKPSLKSKKANK
ncbi:formamidopyrimidine-DNA glycosylase [Candidatus Saccharibacteria bacterium]|nr:formamidopyrimidine-DNA glycosylase [Candidatus Saccharibacteria bacterium]